MASTWVSMGVFIASVALATLAGDHPAGAPVNAAPLWAAGFLELTSLAWCLAYNVKRTGSWLLAIAVLFLQQLAAFGALYLLIRLADWRGQRTREEARARMSQDHPGW
jgi:hypothetical protein